MATIYIVEDDVNIREIERYALKNSGYQVEEFECGADLFKRLESKVPALILLDIMLPNEDGLDILTKIRADKNTAKVPIIMVTAKTSELDKVKVWILERTITFQAVWCDGTDLPCQSVIAQNDEYAGRITDCLRKYSGG